ncbi:MAG: Uma2 family endonuclease [Planctomycetota bacterium]|jgi:Uma2 family endonuclease|nr:Uma2 family endonuclease [Planctomycetota bacterium]
MSTAALDTQITADELSHIGMADGTFEIVYGELVELPPMGIHEILLGYMLTRYLDDHVKEHGLGRIFPDGAKFRLARDPDLVRGPDVSFVEEDRIPADLFEKGYMDIAPDFAVEVISDSNSFAEIEGKVTEYLAADVRLIWVINPGTRTACIHTQGSNVRRVNENDELDGGDVIPGFKLRLKDLFEKV